MIRKLTIAVFLAGMLVLSAQAGTFVSYNGEFYFAYPGNWTQVDFQTADYFLSRGDPDVVVDFEAVFHEQASPAIFQGQYLVLTVDTVGQMTTEQIDSVLSRLESEFEREIAELGSSEFLSVSNPEAILFDRANGLAAIETKVSGDDLDSRTNVLVMKFYEGGIANFYFYAPTPEYAANLGLYRQMVMSFSTEDWQSAAPTDPVEVADLDDDENENSSTGRNVALFAGLAMILLIILVSAARSRAKKS